MNNMKMKEIRTKPKIAIAFIVLILGILIFSIAGVTFGSVQISITDVYKIIIEKIFQ